MNGVTGCGYGPKRMTSPWFHKVLKISQRGNFYSKFTFESLDLFLTWMILPGYDVCM